MNSRPDVEDLFMSVVEPPMVAQMLADIREHAELLSVGSKSDARALSGEPVSDLALAERWLADGSLRGLQLRYRFQGDVWFDTLLRLPSGEAFKLVRMRSPP